MNSQKYMNVWTVHANTHRNSTGQGNLIRTHLGITTHISGKNYSVNTILGIPIHNNTQRHTQQ